MFSIHTLKWKQEDEMVMEDSPPNLFNTLIDYEYSGSIDIDTVSDYQVIDQITELNFDIEKKSIGDVLTRWRFSVPEYQRLYSWKTKQHRQIWSEIQMFIDAELRSGQNNVSDVFFGSMYFAVRDDETTLEVIDGQQRLTSIYILLRSIVEKLQELDSSGEIEDDEIQALTTNSIDQIEEILYETTTFGGKQATLRLNKHDDEFFDALIRGEEAQLDYLLSDDREYIDGRRSEAEKISSLIDDFGISDKTIESVDPSDAVLEEFIPIYESNKNLINAYEFYQTKIRKLTAQHDEAKKQVIALANLNNYLQKSYYIGRFQIREAEPDFRMQIFEILNDRGLELTKIDRIRANVVNTFFDEPDKDEYIGKWEDIVTEFGTDSNKIETYLAVYLSIIESEVSSTNEANSELLNAFSSRNIESNVTPQLKSVSKARDFLDKAKELVEYYKDITNPKLEESNLDLPTKYQTQCQEALIRLDELGTSQWHPLILSLYYETATTPEGDAEKFYKVLETTENLNIRRLLVGANPNVFENVFIESAHQFQLSRKEGNNPYEATRQHMVDEVQLNSSQLFSDSFVDLLAQKYAWDTTYTKILFGKVSNQKFREYAETIDRELDMEQIHLEHILPKNLIRSSGDATWLEQFFKLKENELDIAEEIQTYIDLSESDDLDNEDEQRMAEIKSYIRQRFVDDIGNFLLLRDIDNLSASDQPMPDKLTEYYNVSEDFKDIHVNKYFTPSNTEINEDKLERLLEQSEEVKEGNRKKIDQDLIEYFNSFWTYETLQDRRVNLILDILDTLAFTEINDEFGLENNPEEIREIIESQTKEEFEKRLSMRSL